MRVTVLGTGIMGAGMARSLQREGHDVVVWNRTRSKAEEVGVPVADTVTAAVTGADAVVTMLFDVDAVNAVRDELLAALGDDPVWIQSSTLGPDGVRSLDHERLVDAPMLGTKKPADEGKLVVLASGAENLLERARPVFEAVGARTVVAGDAVGDASALKLACNAWIATITAGTAQSLALAQALGVDPSLFLEAISGGPTDSAYAQLKGKAILSGDFTPSFALDGVVKDVGLMVDAGNGVGFPTDVLEAVRSTFMRASEAGHGDEDMAAVRFAFPQ